jgi:hypothetical protein
MLPAGNQVAGFLPAVIPAAGIVALGKWEARIQPLMRPRPWAVVIVMALAGVPKQVGHSLLAAGTMPVGIIAVASSLAVGILQSS